jgi:Holliday junction DNA helicase RuvB
LGSCGAGSATIRVFGGEYLKVLKKIEEVIHVKRTLKLIAGLPRKRLLEEIHYHLRGGDVSRRGLAFYLLDMERRREHKAYGCSSVIQFSDEVLETAPKETRDLLRIARALEDLPEIDRAFGLGELSWSKVREITRVATAETEAKWLEFAKQKKVRAVEWAVSRSKRGEAPKGGGEGLGTPRVMFRIQYLLPPEINELWQVALAKLMGECGAGATPLDGIKRMAEMAILKDPEGNVPGRKDRREPIYTVVYHVSRENLPDQHASPGADKAWVLGEDGRVPIPLEVVKQVAGKQIPNQPPRAARAFEVKDLEDPGNTDAIRFGERGSVPPEERDPKATESLRAAVLARDGHRCAVCGSHGEPRAHHLESHANGGKTLIEYLVTLCLGCHSLVHDRLLVLRVDAQGGLIALDKDGNPLGKSFGLAAVLSEAGEEHPLLVVEREENMKHKDDAPRGASEGFEAKETSPTDPTPAFPTDPTPAFPTDPTPAFPTDPTPAFPTDPTPAALSASSIEELPPVLSARDWRLLEPRLEWSQARRAFLFHPEIFPGVAPFPEAPLDAPRGASFQNGALPENDLGKRELLFSSSLRPLCKFLGLSEFVGQRRLVENLRLAARGARERGEPVGHVLLSGPGGLGKTTLASLLSREMESELKVAMGPLIEEPSQVIGLLSGLKRGDVLFIDEIHRLDAACEECLYAPMEDWALDLVLAQGTRLRTIRLLLERFTLVGATTRLGSLSEPFRARFKLEERLELYGEEDLAEVVLRAGPRFGVSVTLEAAQAMARRGRGTPREALRLLERARDAAQAKGSAGSTIELEDVEEAAERLGIDGEGLRAQDRKILELLCAGDRPMGLQAIASTLGMDPLTLELVCEPHLLSKGYLARGPRGREATAKARSAFLATASRPALSSSASRATRRPVDPRSAAGENCVQGSRKTVLQVIP